MDSPKSGLSRGAAVLSLAAGVLLLGSGPAPAGARFVGGSADASARLGRVVARASGLPFTTTLGGTRAHYQGEMARAEVATLDLGVLGAMLTTPMACGRAPLTPDQLPSPTVADSHSGPASTSRQAAGTGPAGAGREEASARPRALGTATFSSATLAVGELLSSADGRSRSRVELVDGRERRAEAEVRFGHLEIAGGLVELRGLRWHAAQRTGPEGAVLGAGGSFGVEGVEVAGIPFGAATPTQLATALAAANKTLGPFGLRLEPPRVTQTPAGREVTVGPLKVVVGDATAGRPLVGPVMAGLVPVREGLLEALRGGGGGCDPGGAAGLTLTFVDVVAAALTGSGGLDLEVGGVAARTEGVDYGDPLGLVAPGLPTLPADARPEHPDRSVPPELAATPPPPESKAAPDPARSAPASDTALVVPPAPITAAAPATRRCESTSTGQAPACSRGAPLAASAAAFATGLALFGADYRRSRRSTVSRASRTGHPAADGGER